VDGKPARVTIRHLLTHTSGLGEISPAEGRPLKTLAEVVPLYVAKPVRFEPGTNWNYCQSGINTAARVVEVVSGASFDVVVERRLFGPLGMMDTSFYLTEDQLPRLARPYRRSDRGELEATEFGILNGRDPTSRDRFPAANGGLFSTAPDYVRFCQMLLNGGEYEGRRYLKPESVKLMSTVQTGQLKTGFTEGNGWGLGCCVVREPQGVTAMLSPGTFGHGGAYGTQAWIDPAKKRIYLLMVQRANFPNSDASEVRRAFQEAASSALDSTRFEQDIRAYEREDEKSPPPRGAVLFIGASSTRLWKTLARDFPEHAVINRGFGGSQIADSVADADRIVIPYKPRLIVLQAGGNDINAGKTPEQVLADFKAFVEKVRARLPETRIAFLSLSPAPVRWSQAEKQKRANGLVNEYILSGKNMDFIELWDQFLGPDGKPREDLFLKDRLHNNAEGYKIRADVVRSHLK
jgi:CubicO group peptidase (beta-lactamase class C family)